MGMVVSVHHAHALKLLKLACYGILRPLCLVVAAFCFDKLFVC